MKCKPYSEITVEIRTQLKTVKITSNIFAVYLVENKMDLSNTNQKLKSVLYICVQPDFISFDQLVVSLISRDWLYQQKACQCSYCTSCNAVLQKINQGHPINLVTTLYVLTPFCQGGSKLGCGKTSGSRKNRDLQ